ncbi:MAG: deoxyribose-phosphate aldolase [Clostridia bacterium]|nr:deoxyribose-phosphate aldolase [Clostridia bacterium]
MFGKKNNLITDGLGDLNSKVELTLLNPKATSKDVYNFCNIAYKNRYFGVVVFPRFVKLASSYIKSKLDGAVQVIACVDFPFGESQSSAKIASAKKCFSDGADEVDFCVSSGLILEEDYRAIRTEISRVVRSSHKKVVKAVIETSFLDREQIARITKVLVKCKVDYIMTNSGFGQGGVTPEIVEIIASSTKNKCGIKASGGVSNKVIANNLVRMGATRIGTSRVL